ncbi:MAG: hypothetical protein OER83_05600 [Flavobacteriaceae bacterium]|nr:hypothetical protein [Flavobacteriaceae bacterium]MDH3796328.1 hypothetical protein [Flavobacteriaceae bacterium]
MKYIMLAVLSLAVLKGCSNKDSNIMDITEIKYTASTRGYFYQVMAMPTMLQITMDRTSESGQLYAIEIEEWDTLLGLIEDIELKKLDNIEPATTWQEVDRAPIAGLVVKTLEKKFESPNFDHGNPPAEIRPLVDALLELAERTIEK